MIPLFNSDHLLDRRKFLNLGARGMGALGLASLAQRAAVASSSVE